ncbi:MAG TPA: ABC transporter permease [Anaerolineae bacterium]|nr:ABC transporter permease [Anaerolineae bacterium]HNU03619.1 ABC transporter permease [Anaerolineae bacterium]
MQKTLMIMASEIRTTLRRKSFVIIAIVVPLLLSLISLGIGLINRNAMESAMAEMAAAPAPSSTAAGYVDPGGLIQTVPADLPADRLRRFDDEAAAQAAVQAKAIVGYYLIAPDYVQSGRVTYVTPEFSVLSDSLDSRLLEQLLLVNILDGDANLADAVLQPFDVQLTSLAPAVAPTEESWIGEMFPLFMVLILYMALLIPGGILINALLDEKKNRVMEVLMTSVSAAQMVTGKVAALGLLGLLMTVLWLGVLWAISSFGGSALSIPAGFSIPTSLLLWALIYFVGGYAIYGAQFAGIGALAPDVSQTKSVTWIVMLPILVAYMFMATAFSDPTSPFAVFLSLFPLTSSVAMIGRMAATEVPLWQAVLAAVLQFITAYFIIRLTARLFRAQHLLAGQSLTPKVFYKTLFGRA